MILLKLLLLLLPLISLFSALNFLPRFQFGLNHDAQKRVVWNNLMLPVWIVYIYIFTVISLILYAVLHRFSGECKRVSAERAWSRERGIYWGDQLFYGPGLWGALRHTGALGAKARVWGEQPTNRFVVSVKHHINCSVFLSMDLQGQVWC